MAFSKESQYTKEKIYIIKYCEKMNKESANTMLKFLEEPSSNVIGFFITEHIGNVLSTIQSRCQKIEVNYENDIDEFECFDENILNIAKEIIKKVEKKEIYSIFTDENYFENLEKDDIVKVFQCMLKIYLKCLNIEMKIEKKEIKEIDFLKNVDSNIILKRLNLIENILNELSYNVNINLLIDKFLIEMDEINEGI